MLEIKETNSGKIALKNKTDCIFISIEDAIALRNFLCRKLGVPKQEENKERNFAIYQMSLNEELSLEDIARMYGLSRTRVSQIINSYERKLTKDES